MATEEEQDLLVLDSRLAELSRAQLWAEALAQRLGLSDKTRYAILLCLEEALANIVLHGYRGEAGHPIFLRNRLEPGVLFVAIEDEAPAFAPADDAAPGRELASLETLTPGGYGIQLLRHFADSMVYERLSKGNRLTMSFSLQAAGQ